MSASYNWLATDKAAAVLAELIHAQVSDSKAYLGRPDCQHILQRLRQACEQHANLAHGVDPAVHDGVATVRTPAAQDEVLARLTAALTEIYGLRPFTAQEGLSQAREIARRALASIPASRSGDDH